MTILEDEVLMPGQLGGLNVTKAIEANPHLNVLIYGEYGAGKTLLAGSADEVPEMRKVLFLDIEGGTFTLKHKYPNTEVVRITNWNQMADIYKELRAGLHIEYNTIVIDSLSEAQVFNMDEIMRQLVLLKPERNEDVPDIREWGINQKQVKRFIRLYRDLPVTVIMTALMKEDKLPDGARKKGADLPGKLANQVPALFDEVWYLYVRQLDAEQRGLGEEFEGKRQTRLLSTGATEKAAGKDRSGKLAPIIIEPSMASIWETMMKGDNK
jgi:hypothetical protein